MAWAISELEIHNEFRTRLNFELSFSYTYEFKINFELARNTNSVIDD